MAALAGEGLSNKELEPEPSVDPQLLAIAQNFYHTYYQTFDTNRSAVGPLYVSYIPACKFMLLLFSLSTNNNNNNYNMSHLATRVKAYF